MPNNKPTLYNLKGITKFASKTEQKTCAGCKRTFELKPGRVFICLFCGDSIEGEIKK